jgi:hypothetical protein
MSEIKGYRKLSEVEISEINELKEIETDILGKINYMGTCGHLDKRFENIDKRWLAIGKTHIEEGFMAIVRSIAKPEPLI